MREVAPAPSSDAAASSQSVISDEIARLAEQHQAPRGAPEPQPLLDYPPYRSSVLRHPTQSLQPADPEEVELWAPVFGDRDVDPVEADLTVQHGGDPIGERMILTGRVLDGDGRPVRRQLVEIWQADDEGRYRFTTIKPGPYPWRNHRNAWRPAHIHFSVFGTEFTQRMVTQMYFPNDPLFPLDPIYQSVVDPQARERLVAAYDHDLTQPEWCTGYRWDIVLTGPHRTLTEADTGGTA
jgi:protocatechuate 3,4-dioxygenase beta subunit